jgi:hypothetical protein
MTPGWWKRLRVTWAPGTPRRPGPLREVCRVHTDEACEDVDPMPDYENVLTD